MEIPQTIYFLNHTIQELRIGFIILPSLFYFSSHIIYFHNKPFIRNFFYITIWVIVLTLIEILLVKGSILTYHRGWNVWWTVLFWYVSLPVIRHYTKPLWGWVAALGLTFLTLLYFQVPIGKLD